MTRPYLPHPIVAGIAPAVIWTVRTVAGTAVTVAMFALLIPWWARHHGDTEALARAFPIILVAGIAWIIADHRLRAALRLRVPGALGRNDATPHPADIAVAALECAFILAAILIACQATATMDDVGTLLVALALGATGAAVVPTIRRVYRDSRDMLPGWKTRLSLEALRMGVPATVALWQGWSLVPARFATDGRMIIAFALLVAAGVLLIQSPLRNAGRLSAAHRTSRPRQTRAITISHATSVRTSIHEAADTAGDGVLSWVDPAPTLETRARAHHRARAATYCLIVLAALVCLALILV